MFTERVKDQLHVVLAMSPIGDAFRTRLRMFPSLVNCCTIDWFQVRHSLYSFTNYSELPLIWTPELWPPLY